MADPKPDPNVRIQREPIVYSLFLGRQQINDQELAPGPRGTQSSRAAAGTPSPRSVSGQLRSSPSDGIACAVPPHRNV
jgi:hypothetical protein